MKRHHLTGAELTEREVMLRTDGLSNQEMADQLHIKLSSAKFDCSTIYRKRKSADRQSAVIRAIERKLLEVWLLLCQAVKENS